MSGRPCAVYHPQTPLPETLESLAAQVPLRRRRCESDATEVSGSVGVGVGVGRPVGSEAVRFSSFVLRSALCAVCPSSPPAVTLECPSTSSRRVAGGFREEGLGLSWRLFLPV